MRRNWNHPQAVLRSVSAVASTLSACQLGSMQPRRIDIGWSKMACRVVTRSRENISHPRILRTTLQTNLRKQVDINSATLNNLFVLGVEDVYMRCYAFINVIISTWLDSTGSRHRAYVRLLRPVCVKLRRFDLAYIFSSDDIELYWNLLIYLN